jgi:hypothetical protein
MEMINQNRIEVQTVGRRTLILVPSLLAAIEGAPADAPSGEEDS